MYVRAQYPFHSMHSQKATFMLNNEIVLVRLLVYIVRVHIPYTVARRLW